MALGGTGFRAPPSDTQPAPVADTPLSARITILATRRLDLYGPKEERKNEVTTKGIEAINAMIKWGLAQSPAITAVDMVSLLEGEMLFGYDLWLLLNKNRYDWSGGFARELPPFTPKEVYALLLKSSAIEKRYAPYVSPIDVILERFFPTSTQKYGDRGDSDHVNWGGPTSGWERTMLR